MRITQRQLRQIIKEELRRSIRESHYPHMPAGPMQASSGTGTIGFSTSVIQDGPYTWQFAISPTWSNIKSNIQEDMTAYGTESPVTDYSVQDMLDNFQISIINVKPGTRLPGRMTAGDLPAQLFDMETGYFNVDKTLAALERIARSQGKSNLADNLAFIIEAKAWFEDGGHTDI